MSGTRKNMQTRVRTAALVLSAMIILLSLLLFLIPLQKKEGAVSPVKKPAEPALVNGEKKGDNDSAEGRYTLYIVLDDAGNSLKDLQQFLDLDLPLTYAVMPQRRYTSRSIQRIKSAGQGWILHQPMEPIGSSDPGPGAIMAGMSSKQISEVLDRNLKDMPGLKGMNNHMGSKVTSDPETINRVMAELNRRDLFFLDSMTTSKTAARQAAEKFDVIYRKRTGMFLDNEKDHESIRNAVLEGMRVAEKKGHAVMIGHVMTNELADVLLEMYPGMLEQGYTLKYLSELFYGDMTDDGSWD